MYYDTLVVAIERYASAMREHDFTEARIAYKHLEGLLLRLVMEGKLL